jgi:hypothetical protein
MRVLLDENLPVGLVEQVVGHEASTVASLGWIGIANGELLRRADGLFDALLTMDRNLERQHAIGSLSFGVVVLVARSNRISDLQVLLPDVLHALESLQPGALVRIGA